MPTTFYFSLYSNRPSEAFDSAKDGRWRKDGRTKTAAKNKKQG